MGHLMAGLSRRLVHLDLQTASTCHFFDDEGGWDNATLGNLKCRGPTGTNRDRWVRA